MIVVNREKDKSILQFLVMCRFEAEHDDYSIIMVKALADRLAEVCSTDEQELVCQILMWCNIMHSVLLVGIC